MAYDWKPFLAEAKEAEDWLVQEYGSLRTGRATPAVLDTITVESYGSQMKLRELAAISLEDPRTLRIAPWDSSQGKDIAAAITAAGTGLAVAVDDRGVRVSFPPLTSERRTLLMKVAKEKLEEARKRIRVVRDEAWRSIQDQQKEGKMSEDEKFRLKDQMEKYSKEGQDKLEGHYDKKEKEISE